MTTINDSGYPKLEVKGHNALHGNDLPLGSSIGMASDRGLNSLNLVYTKEMRSHGSQVDVEVRGAPSYLIMPDETTFGSTCNIQDQYQQRNSMTTSAANTQTMYLIDPQID